MPRTTLNNFNLNTKWKKYYCWVVLLANCTSHHNPDSYAAFNFSFIFPTPPPYAHGTNGKLSFPLCFSPHNPKRNPTWGVWFELWPNESHSQTVRTQLSLSTRTRTWKDCVYERPRKGPAKAKHRPKSVFLLIAARTLGPHLKTVLGKGWRRSGKVSSTGTGKEFRFPNPTLEDGSVRIHYYRSALPRLWCDARSYQNFPLCCCPCAVS